MYINTHPNLWSRRHIELESIPPGWAAHARRMKTLENLDAQIVSHELADDADFIEFYRNRIGRAVQALKKDPPEGGTVRLVKLYSSGVAVSSKTGAFGIDIVDGPVRNDRAPEDLEGTPFPGFTMTENQRTSLADRLDVLLITHFHHDHGGYGMARAMIRAGKKVVAPDQCKEYWLKNGASWAEKISVPAPDEIHSYPFCSFRFWPGTQHMFWHDKKKEVPVWNHPENAENNAYLVRQNGLVFLHGGDNRDMNMLPWAARVFSEGWSPDLTFSAGLENVQSPIEKMLGGFRAQVHDYEFLHPKFNRLPRRWEKSGEERFRSGKEMDLFWGESVLFGKNGFTPDSSC